MLQVAGVATGVFEVVVDDYTPFDLRASDASAVEKVVSLNHQGRALATLGAQADGAIAYVTLVSYADPPDEAGSAWRSLAGRPGVPRLDLAACGFSEGYETVSRPSPLRLAQASDGFDLRLAEGGADSTLDAGPVRFVLAGARLVGISIRNLEPERIRQVCDILRWTSSGV